MPVVPTYDNLRATPSAGGVMPVQQNYSAEDATGADLQRTGAAMVGAGQDIGRIVLDAQDQANNLAARTIDIDAAQKLDTLQFGKDSGFMMKRGGDAAIGLQDYTDAAKKIGADAIGSSANQGVQQIVNRIISDRVTSATASMTRHAGTEYSKYQVQTSDDRAKVSIQTAANDFTNEQGFLGGLGTAIHEVAAQKSMLGWDDATAKLQEQKYTDDAYRMRYDAWRDADPVGALAHFQQFQSVVSPLARTQLYHQLFEAAAPSLAQQINAAGGVPAAQPNAPSAPGQPATPGDPSLPRGVRNNNPGNISLGPDRWQGAVQGTDPKYVAFESPEAGIRAMGKVLLNYQDVHGLNTVSDIIARWAPATENDSASYTAQVSRSVGVKPDQAIDLHDPAVMTGIVKAMIKVENGKQPYSDQQIASGLSAAAGGAPPPPAAASVADTPNAAPPITVSVPAANAWRDSAVPSGNPLVDALPADWKLHVMQLARGQAQQDMAGARDLLRGKVQDASASYLATGFAPNPPALDEFVRAYGQLEGQAQYAAFQGTAKLGQQLQQVSTLPAAALVTLADQSKPVPGPGFAAAQHNYEVLTQAIDQTTKARQKDPVGYAIWSHSYGMQPINFSDPASVGAQLAQRAGAAPQLATDYGVPPALLSQDEARAFSDTLKAAPVEQQKQYLGAVAAGVNSIPLLKATMQSIAPDQPVMALAGIYQARKLQTSDNRDVADLLLRGQAILTPNRKTDGTGHEGGQSLIKMPEGKLLLSEFNSQTGDAFTGKEQSADLFMQAARAVYAAKSAEAGDYSGSLDTGRWRDAVTTATGGLQSYNGSTIVMPYGMTYDTFQDRLHALAPSLTANAINVHPADLQRLPLENVGDGRYLFRRGAGYLVDKAGRPVTVDMNAPLPAPLRLPPASANRPALPAVPAGGLASPLASAGAPSR